MLLFFVLFFGLPLIRERNNIRLKLKPSTLQLAKAFTVYNIHLDL